jgi:hypothetical protein
MKKQKRYTLEEIYQTALKVIGLIVVIAFMCGSMIILFEIAIGVIKL